MRSWEETTLKTKGRLGSAYSEIVPRLRRMGVRFSVDGEDVAQDAYVRALQSERRGETVVEPVAYLLRVARNLFIDRKRTDMRESALLVRSDRIDTVATAAPDPERILAGKQRLDIALAAIGRLPPRCREAFELHRFEGLSYTAIARRMGISTSMVEKHIAEAMARLARAVNHADGPGV